MNLKNEALKLHQKLKGKISVESKYKIKSKKDLSLLYTPGVAEVSRKIYEDKENIYKYTMKQNSVAIISDGSAVLGLGDIGVEAALPVMEGKAILFKEFANIDGIPLCIKRNNVDEFIQSIINLNSNFGGINLEDIKAPYCFEIEEILKEKLDIPVFHDDQHGTAIVVLAGLLNSLKLVNKNIENLKIVITGAGAAGYAITNLLKKAGATNITVLDVNGVVYKNRKDNNRYLEKLAVLTDKKKKGELNEVIKNSDVFIGVSAGGILKKSMVKKMNNKPIIFALANPEPEIDPKLAKEAGAYIVATGRSDFNNQINNVLAFPGIFRGALDVRATEITDKMKIKAAYEIADVIKDNISKEKIIPEVFNKEVSYCIALAVAKEAIESNLIMKKVEFEDVEKKITNNLK